ncbi:MAG: shikimate dehydrogenase [Verrucomicrobia bacterium]|nr:shikimate dehydrogenase [Verrucomicrobiota bacterium]
MSEDRKLSGHTKPYAVLGHPIGHTLSPVMHNASLRALGLDAIYLAFDVAPQRLMDVLSSMRDMGFGGVNLTVPLKEVAFKGLSLLDDSAQRLGAVNTVEFLPDGGMRGHNTDGDGFVAALEESSGRGLAGSHVFVCGSGGAGRAVALTCCAKGAARVEVTDLDDERARRVCADMQAQFPALQTGAVPAGEAAWVAASQAADLVIQSTPVGMKREDPSVLPPEAFRKGQRVFDLVYMYPQTAFMKLAQQAGAQATNGLGMLLHQGARAFEIWTGAAPDVSAMRAALERAVYGEYV